MDSFFSNSTLPFIGIQFFVGTTMVCVKKLYTIMCHIEEDKNRKFYTQYYKIGMLESDIVTLREKVSDLTQVCAQLEEKITRSAETCPMDEVTLQMPEKPGFDDCIEVVLTNAVLTADANADVNAEVGLSIQEELVEKDEVLVQPVEPEGHDGNAQKDAYKYKYGLGFLMGSK